MFGPNCVFQGKILHHMEIIHYPNLYEYNQLSMGKKRGGISPPPQMKEVSRFESILNP
jgi:hypothetical protein